MSEKELMYLAGLLEGEGSFLAGAPSAPNKIRVTVQMTDRDVVEKVAVMFGDKAVLRAVPRNSRWKTTYRTTVTGRAAADLMRRLYPHMGVRRRAQIDRVLAEYVYREPGEASRKLSDADVQQIQAELGTSSLSTLARKYAVTRVVIRRIRDGERGAVA